MKYYSKKMYQIPNIVVAHPEINNSYCGREGVKYVID